MMNAEEVEMMTWNALKRAGFDGGSVSRIT